MARKPATDSKTTAATKAADSKTTENKGATPLTDSNANPDDNKVAGADVSAPAAEAAAKKKADEKKAKRAAARDALKQAKTTLFNFRQTKEFKALPPDVQDAIVRLAPEAKKGGGGAKTAITDVFSKLFPKVGATVGELDLFKETKWGPSEMRKRVRAALKKAKPEDRKWISYDEDKETWTLVGVGAEAPKAWK